MNPGELHRRAIAVVAKLSIFAGAAGCAGTVTIDSDTETETEIDADTGNSTDTDLPEEPAPEEPATLPDLPPDSFVPSCVAGAVNEPCCNAVLTKAFADPEYFTTLAHVTEHHVACCTLVLDVANAWNGPEALPFHPDLAWGCCTVADDCSQTCAALCTAWGPPMPPAMPRRPPHRVDPLALDSLVSA